MNKTRGLLSLVALLTIAVQVFILHSHLSNVWRFTLHVADGIPLFSALTMLLFSFFRVGVMADGELCYNPDNWYWKTMAWFYDPLYFPLSSPFERGKVSLCKAFWLTVFAILIIIGLSVLAFVLVSLIWDAYLKFGLLKMILTVVLIATGVAALLGACYGLSVGEDKIKNKYYQAVADRPRLRNAAETTGDILMPIIAIGVLFSLTVVMPILVIMDIAKVPLYTAIVYYLVGVAGLALTVGGAAFLIWLIFKYLPRIIGNTVLGQFLAAKKKRFCPTLTRCCT